MHWASQVGPPFAQSWAIAIPPLAPPRRLRRPLPQSQYSPAGADICDPSKEPALARLSDRPHMAQGALLLGGPGIQSEIVISNVWIWDLLASRSANNESEQRARAKGGSGVEPIVEVDRIDGKSRSVRELFVAAATAWTTTSASTDGLKPTCGSWLMTWRAGS